jgi:phage terminase large subunit-like protein
MDSLRPSDFLRMHRVEWVTTEEQFMPIDWYDNCTTLTAPLTLRPDSPARVLPIVIGVDIGTKHDCTAAVGMYYDMLKPEVGLAFHRIWTPPPTQTGLDLEATVEQYLLEMSQKFKIAAIVYDPHNFHRSMVTLRKKGLPLIEYTQNGSLMISATQNMYDLFRHGVMAVYKDDELRQHVHFAKAKVDERGFRLVKEANSTYHIDGAVAMAMAAYHVVKVGGIDTSKRIKIDSPFSDATAWTPNYINQDFLPEALRSKN